MQLPARSPARALGHASLALAAFAAFALPVSGAPLQTMNRTMHTYAWGDKAFTCLVVDRSLLPLSPPFDAKLSGENESLVLMWDNTQATARFRSATLAESGLLGNDASGAASTGIAQAENWSRLVSNIPSGAEHVKCNGVEPDALPVNNWRTALASWDYTLAGQDYSAALLLCRCSKTMVLAVTLTAPKANFPDCRKSLLGMLGAVSPIPLSE